MAEEKINVYCSFCGRSDKEVKAMIAGSDVFICDCCVELCRDIIGSHRIKAREKEENEIQGQEDEIPMAEGPQHD